MTCRINLIIHGSTPGMRHAVFPGDERLDDHSAVERLRGRFATEKVSRAQASPALRARQTAEALGLQCTEEEALRDLDYGTWAGRELAEVQRENPPGVAAWREDPEAVPHGGESIAHLLRRVGRWLDTQAELGGRVVAITHSPVVRVAVVHAIGAPLTSFWRLDTAPLTGTDLRHDGRRWAVRAFGEPIA